MPIIQPYEGNVLPQGVIGVRANPDDFGAQVGAGMERLGAGLSDVAQANVQADKIRDVSGVHKTMFKARGDWTQNLVDRANNADPNDENFVPRLMTDMGDWFEKGADSAATPAGKELYANLSAQIMSEFKIRAISVQGELAARAATEDHQVMETSLGSTVYDDPSQLEAAIAQGKAAIDDPNGIYAKVPVSVRTAFKDQLERKLTLAKWDKKVEVDPLGFLRAVDPEVTKQSAPWKSILYSNTAPGGKVTVSPETMPKVPAITEAASASGVNPNIAVAQADVEKDQPPAELASDMAALLSRYGGDYTKALAAYHSGTDVLDTTLQQWGGGWASHLPADAQSYVQTVLVNSGSVAHPNPDQAGLPSSQEELAPKKGTEGEPLLKGLSWEEKSQLVTKAVQLQHLQMSMALQAREEEKYQLGLKQDQAMDGILDQIVEPAKFGRISDDDILKNSVLTWQQKQHAIDYKFARNRELNSAAESQENHEEVRRLEQLIYAADDDPTKIYSMDPIMASYRLRRISTKEMRTLRGEVGQLRDGNNNSFQRSLYEAKQTVESALTKSTWGAAQPEVAASAVYAFKAGLDAKVKARRDANKNPYDLLDPASPDFALKPETIQSYLTGAKGNVAKAAGVVREQSFNQLPVVNDDAAYAALEGGQSYRTATGAVLVKGKAKGKPSKAGTLGASGGW